MTASWERSPASLLWSGRLPAGPSAIAVVERLSGRQLGPNGRELVSQAAGLKRAGERGGGAASG